VPHSLKDKADDDAKMKMFGDWAFTEPRATNEAMILMMKLIHVCQFVAQMKSMTDSSAQNERKETTGRNVVIEGLSSLKTLVPKLSTSINTMKRSNQSLSTSASIDKFSEPFVKQFATDYSGAAANSLVPLPPLTVDELALLRSSAGKDEQVDEIAVRGKGKKASSTKTESSSADSDFWGVDDVIKYRLGQDVPAHYEVLADKAKEWLEVRPLVMYPCWTWPEAGAVMTKSAALAGNNAPYASLTGIERVSSASTGGLPPYFSEPMSKSSLHKGAPRHGSLS